MIEFHVRHKHFPPICHFIGVRSNMDKHLAIGCPVRVVKGYTVVDDWSKPGTLFNLEYFGYILMNVCMIS